MVLGNNMAFDVLLSSLEQSGASFLEIRINYCSNVHHLEDYAWSRLTLRGYLATKIRN